jgi:hypothetical protein
MSRAPAAPTRRSFVAATTAVFATTPTLTGHAADDAAMVEASRLFNTEARYLAFAVFLSQAPDQYNALIGNEVAAFALHQKPKLAAPGAFDDVHVTGALGAIAAAASDKRVVILNEAHHVSRDRLFALDVARALRPLGFDVLAGETFQSDPAARFDDDMNAGAPVTTWRGTYTSDPVYAETLRSCRALGYRFAAYEAVRAGGVSMADRRRREAEETRRLLDLLRTQPQSRVLIYCGYGHAATRPVRGFTPMAARLKAVLGDRLLTINQSWGAPAPNPKDTPPLVRALIERFDPIEPVMVLRGAGSFDPGDYPPGSFDFSVLHPAVAPVAGRPGWLARSAVRARADVRLQAAAQLGALAQAVPLDEFLREPATVPSDQYPITEAGVLTLTFWLRPGRYLVRLETPAGFTEISRTLV